MIVHQTLHLTTKNKYLNFLGILIMIIIYVVFSKLLENYCTHMNDRIYDRHYRKANYILVSTLVR